MIYKIFTACLVLAVFIACLVEVSTGGNPDAWIGVIGIPAFTIVGWIIWLTDESDPFQ